MNVLGCYNKHMNTQPCTKPMPQLLAEHKERKEAIKAESTRRRQLARTQAAYSHFTLAQWQVLNNLVQMSNLGYEETNSLLSKFPSASFV